VLFQAAARPTSTEQPFLPIFIMLAKTRDFFSEVKVELQKASWPWESKEKGMKKYKELVDSTLIVVIAMLLMSGYVAFWDFVMVNIVGALTR
jgi:preprotein translocase subunit SecE